jgi:uncharacterized protein
MVVVIALIQASAIAGIAAFFIVWIGIWLPIAIFLTLQLHWQPWQPLTMDQKLPLLMSLYLLAPLILWGAAVVTGTSFTAYGLPGDWAVLPSLGLGLLIGMSSLAGMLAIEVWFGWLNWHPQLLLQQPSSQLAKTLLSTLLLGLWVGITEELIFRGFLINQLQQDYSTWVAAAISSLIFSLLHLVWEGKENIPQLPGLWLMGMVLVLARWIDGGNLGLAWGLHAGWVWAIASLDSTQLLISTQPEAAWLTGKGGKPLAGVLGILFLVATGVILWQFY